MSLTGKALFVIERNLDCDLSLGEIAGRCGVSRFHLAHAFGEATGLSVMEYVRARRLTEAAYALAGGAGDILSVALDRGYGSHEAFGRAFKSHFGRTPDEVRKSESVAGLNLTAAIAHRESKRTALGEPRIEKAGEMLFAGLKERVGYGAMQNIAGQWQRFMSGPYHGIENRKPGIPVGIAATAGGEGIDYVCAAEVTRFGAVPGGLVKLTLAPRTYAVFSHDAHIAKLRETYDAIWNEWFADAGRTPADAPGFERHNETFDPRTGEGGACIWIPLEGGQ